MNREAHLFSDGCALSRLHSLRSCFVEVTNRPVCASKERDLFIYAQPPRLGKAGNATSSIYCAKPICGKNRCAWLWTPRGSRYGTRGFPYGESVAEQAIERLHQSLTKPVTIGELAAGIALNLGREISWMPQTAICWASSEQTLHVNIGPGM
jgi:hypothetical protein